MQPVRQEHKTSCGIAAVATVTGLPYSSIMAVAHTSIWSRRRAGQRYSTSTKDIRTLLETLGEQVGPETKADCWAEIPNLAIVAINPRSKGRKWHWVVYRRTPNGPVVLYPNGGVARSDFGRMKPHFYLPIDN